MQIPPFLRPGDTVGVVSPASWFPYEEAGPGLRMLRDEWRLNVLEGDSLRAKDGPFAGSDDLRRADLQRFFDDPGVRAVLATRGGYGSYRIVDGLDLTGLRTSPKWLVGFSDVTVLLSTFYNHGVMSLHGPTVRQFGAPERTESVELLRRWLFGQGPVHYDVPAHPLNRPGEATGPLVGGNLTLLVNSLGTPTDVALAGTVLFIEDVGETYFSLDRMLTQLKRAGRLAGLAGLVAGQFTEMRANASLPFGKDTYQIIADAVAEYAFPVVYDFPAGHVDHNLTLPIGHPVTLSVSSSGATLAFAATY